MVIYLFIYLLISRNLFLLWLLLAIRWKKASKNSLAKHTSTYVTTFDYCFVLYVEINEPFPQVRCHSSCLQVSGELYLILGGYKRKKVGGEREEMGRGEKGGERSDGNCIVHWHSMWIFVWNYTLLHFVASCVKPSSKLTTLISRSVNIFWVQILNHICGGSGSWTISCSKTWENWHGRTSALVLTQIVRISLFSLNCFP